MASTPKKTRMTALDVRAAVTELRPRLVGLRLANVYDISFSRRLYMLKFAKGDFKEHILVESGIRFHPTHWQRDKNGVPSAFVMRLRKFLRTRRLEDFRQLGADRVIDFVFGTGEKTTHLLVELYVSGNVILTDYTYKILSILRPHARVESAGRFAVNETYPVNLAFDLRVLTRVPALMDLWSKGQWNATFSTEPDAACRFKESVVQVRQATEWRTTLEAVENQLRESHCKTSDAQTIVTPMEAEAGEAVTLQCAKPRKKCDSPSPAARQKSHGQNLSSQEALMSQTVPKLTCRDALSQLVPFAHPGLLHHSLLQTRDIVVELRNVGNGPMQSSRASGERLFSTPDQNASAFQQLEWIVLAALNCLCALRSVSTSDDLIGNPDTASAASVNNALVPIPIKGWAVCSGPKRSTCEDGPTPSTSSPTDAVSVPVKQSSSTVLIEFSPVFLSHFQLLRTDKEHLQEFDSFLSCLDAYFSTVEISKQEKAEKQAGDLRLSKAEKIKYDQDRRIQHLHAEQEISSRNASLIEANIQVVDQCIAMLQEALIVGVSWRELWNYIKQERRNGHPLASIIHGLALEKNEAILLLAEDPSDEVDSEKAQPQAVNVDLTLSAYGNVALLHERRKALEQKSRRTADAAHNAVTQASAKAAKKEKEKLTFVGLKGVHSGIVPIRKHFWFEKFNWFISTENFLVLAGRDAVQNDMLYKRYFEKNDIYVHADAHGAPSCIIKNPTSSPIPPLTLLEAGRMSVCRSSAWDHKLVTGSWWVYPSQVSKTVPAGEYIVSGAFIIRGKKNMLPPSKLEMGLGILFQLGDDSLALHENERKPQCLTTLTALAGVSAPAELRALHHQGNAESTLFPSEEQRQEVESFLEREDVALSEARARRQAQILEKKQKGVLHTGEVVQNTQNWDNHNVATESGLAQDTLTHSVPISAATTQGAHVRGKKSKLKKMKEKYKEQTPEERQARMALLGSKEMKHERVLPSHTTQRSPTNASPAEQRTMRAPTPTPTATALSTSGFQSLDLKQDQLSQRNSAASPEADCFQEKDADLNATGAARSHEALHSKLVDIQSLTPHPHPEATLLSAIPVCAPWTTLQNYKYKVKLVPGAGKKGKAVQQVVKVLVHQADRPLERELIRLINMNDLSNAIVGNVQVASPAIPSTSTSGKHRNSVTTTAKAAI